jgi:hypothetical protein
METGDHKMGPSLLLKVMSGDKIDLSVQPHYNTGTTNTLISSVLTCGTEKMNQNAYQGKIE